MSNENARLRFAALIRVSTEKQEKTGESLRTQKSDIERAVSQLGGTIVEWYGGQEHATPNYEKKEVNRLISDAKRGKFNAVVVAYLDRWSRDNYKSKEGLKVFREHNIGFFVGSNELDLLNPQDSFTVGILAEIGELQAATQKLKSIRSRIHRAKEGRPTSGRLPFGRTFDKRSARGEST